MAGKQETAETSWRRPLAQKLSSLMNRRSSVKGDKSEEASGDKRSVFRSKRQDAAQPRSASAFKPLEVELAAAGADGWLQTEARKHSDREADQPEPPQSVPDRTKTPIADLFASKSILDFDVGAESHDHGSKPSRRPVSMFEPKLIMQQQQEEQDRGSSSRATEASAGAESILNRGRPVESRYSYVDMPPKMQELPTLQPVQRDAFGVRRAATADARKSWPVQPPQASLDTEVPIQQASAPARRSIQEPRALVEPETKVERVSLRSSSPAPSSFSTIQPPRSSSAAPLDRIQAWQKSIPAKVAPKPVESTAPAPPGFAPLRRASTKGFTSDRLAWIRELEEKKSHGVNQEMGGLRRAQTGSVSGKLALFENKQALALKPPATSRPSALNRSNSNTSRFSVAGPDSSFSATSNVSASAATPRTSLDTLRSSNRASSVMSYYDDSFREKMETIVGSDSYSPDKEQGEFMSNKQRISMRFVPVEPKKAEGAPEPQEAPVGPETESTKAEAVPQTEASIQADEPLKVAEPHQLEAAQKVEEAQKLDEAPKTVEVPQIVEELLKEPEAPPMPEDAPRAEETPCVVELPLAATQAKTDAAPQVEEAQLEAKHAPETAAAIISAPSPATTSAPEMSVTPPATETS